jgi:hypothetical protein
LKALVALLALGVVGCGSNVCDGVKGTCVAVHVTAGSSTPGSVEQLSVDVSGAVSGGPVRTPPAPSKKNLPVDVAVGFSAGRAGTETVHVVAFVGGAPVAEGSASFQLTDGKHQTVDVALVGTNLPPNDMASGDGGIPDLAGLPPGDMTKPMLSFTKKTPVACGGNPVAVKLGDFRGQGPIDVAIGADPSGSGELDVFFGDGAGNYPATPSYTSTFGFPARDVAVINLFGVAQQDILVSDGRFTVYGYLHAAGSPPFTAGGGVNVSAIGQGPGFMTVNDFDMDGKPDAVVVVGACGGCTTGGACLVFLKGKGDGSLIAPTCGNVTSLPSVPNGIGNGVFRDPMKPDILVGQDATNMGIMADNGVGGFSTPPTKFPAGSTPTAFAPGDFNGDRKLDVAVADHGGSVNVLLGNGDGTFQAAVPFSAGGMPSGIVTADFDGDRILDLAVVNSGSNNVSVLIGDGTGNFSAPHNFMVGGAPSAIAAGDLNADTKPDLVVTNQADGNFTILLNSTM